MKNTVKNKKTIDLLFTEGKTLVTKNLLFKTIKGEDKFLVTVSSKVFKRAVDRNKIKRMLRDVIKSNEVKGTFALVYIGKEIPNLEVLKDEFKIIVSKNGK